MIKDDRLPLKEKFLEYYRELPNQGLAADSIGRSEDTISLWKKEDSEFSDEVSKAKADWAKSKVRRIKNEEWLLERVLRDQFSNRNQITDGDNNAIQGLVIIKDGN